MIHNKWQYPLFVVPVPGGFASVFDNDADETQQSLLAFSDSNAAILFIATFGLLSAPRPLKNDRELAWLLRGIQKPVVNLLVDANPANPDSASGQLHTIEHVLENLTLEYSPWDYPVFAIGKEQGFVCIDGAAEDGEWLSAIALFSSEQKVQDYLEHSKEQGELCLINNQQEAIVFLRGIRELVTAVAIDPYLKNNKHAAKFCFSIDTLLDKYLVVENSD